MRVFAYGRLQNVPNRTWERVLRQHGGERARTARSADLIVVGAGAASRSPAQIGEDLRRFRAGGRIVLSERAFLRRIGLLSALAEEQRSFSAADLAGRAKLAADMVDLLVLFDLVEPDEAGRCGFRDVKSAIQAARLLQRTSLSDLVFACIQIRETLAVNSPLSQLTLDCEEDGRIVLGAGDRIADLTGQLRLGFVHDAPSVSVLLANAEEAQDTGDVRQAIQLLRRVLAAAPKSLDALFELGSLLCEQGEFSEGLALLRKATVLRPKFADAWYNIGHALERQGRRSDACDAYQRAIVADPDYPDPLYNLGMISLDEGRFTEAISQLERYLYLDPDSEWSGRARKAVSLARMSLVKAAG